MKKFIFIILAVVIFCSFFMAKSQKENITKLQFLSWGSKSEVQVLNYLIREYENNNPCIKIEFIHAPANYFQKLHLLIASNLVPDVVFVNNINAELYFQSGVFEDLNPYINKDSSVAKEVYFDNALKALTRKGSLYAIPRDVSNLVVYYNKTLFKQYGVEIPDKSWTYSEFLQIAKKLTKDTNGDGKTDIFGFGFEEKPIFWLPFLWSQGGGILNDNGDLIINKKASKEGLKFYSDLRSKYKVAPSRSEIASLTTAQMFMQGKLAMHVSGRWNVPKYRQEIDFDWDIINFPNGKCGSIVDSDASGWAISSASTKKQQAWDFIKFLASKDSIEEFTKSGLIIPARTQVANSKVFLNGKPKSSYVYIEALENAIPTPVNSSYNELLDSLNIELEYLWMGKKNVDEVINKIQP